MNMDFFQHVAFDALPETCRDNGKDVVTTVILPMCCGPSFVMEGDLASITAEDVFQTIVQMADREKAALDRMGPNLVSYIHRFPVEAQQVRMEKSDLLYSLFVHWYSLNDDKVESLEKLPFHADDRMSDTVVEIETAFVWGTYPTASFGKWNYIAAPEYECENSKDRARRFALEDLFDLVNRQGGISLHRSLSGEILEDQQEMIWSQSRSAGVRDGYYEVHDRVERGAKFISEDQPGYGKGYTEVLRKELHLVIPAATIYFEMRRMPTPDKPEKVAIRLLKKNDRQVFVLLTSRPEYCRGPFDPDKEKKKEMEKEAKKSFWKSLFKK